jgi:hypothetical protein
MPGDWRSRLWETRVTSVRARAFDTDVSVLGVVSSPTHGRAEHLGWPESANRRRHRRTSLRPFLRDGAGHCSFRRRTAPELRPSRLRRKTDMNTNHKRKRTSQGCYCRPASRSPAWCWPKAPHTPCRAVPYRSVHGPDVLRTTHRARVTGAREIRREILSRPVDERVSGGLLGGWRVVEFPG